MVSMWSISICCSKCDSFTFVNLRDEIEFSSQQGLDLRAVGASKGDQPFVIVSMAFLALQSARDDEDRGAIGHIRITT